jgi:hypothetical protein
VCGVGWTAAVVPPAVVLCAGLGQACTVMAVPTAVGYYTLEWHTPAHVPVLNTVEQAAVPKPRVSCKTMHSQMVVRAAGGLRELHSTRSAAAAAGWYTSSQQHGSKTGMLAHTSYNTVQSTKP